MKINVIGAGLAGCEAAFRLAEYGYKVNLYEMKPIRKSPAHHSNNFAELVCSNSLKAERVSSAAGLMKEEMRRFNSLCMKAADVSKVEAGGALAVDRDVFSDYITNTIKIHNNITVINKIVDKINEEPTIIATGPLTDDALINSIEKLCNGLLHFYDAAAPIVIADSIDTENTFLASRYDKGEGHYINCPMNKEEYETFYEQLINAQRVELKEFEKGDIYEGCMPIEVMASRGPNTIRFGPLKPVGLINPKTGHRPWANVQLRKENKEGTLYNIVGFQTNLKFDEQKRVFSLIPALKNAEFIRYGVMHRNTFINSPKVLNKNLSLKNKENLFFAGQITGVEGYMESAMSGILAAENLKRYIEKQQALILPDITMMGALINYVTDEFVADFQPMGANFGILPALETPIRNKQERYMALSQRSLDWFNKL
ncbi:MAG: methylenetetrahydrofolate--tRNA-(uracil(54)-C(5))-methyltransferase (FADH(2)-oxidizing) TrmFO [Acutalibacteraceae bacterium]|nr:methylenetetrahydrofolate--tRNA-(uracil(54)-C(5))-methyltransferase (FADH(2)-oxidizing) TrmFO [Acutalibacteraceae bacterium]